jgi:hypothetical protein
MAWTNKRTIGAPGLAAPLGSLTLVLLLTACDDTGRAVAPIRPEAPQFTMGSGTTSNLLGRGTFADAFKVKRTLGEWEVEVEARPNLDVAVQRITFQAGGQSGWHSHPGPVFIQVLSGQMTFYESDDPACTPIVRTAGQGYLDVGEHAHIARNETTQPAENLVIYFAPPRSALRIDEPDPGHCPFSRGARTDGGSLGSSGK